MVKELGQENKPNSVLLSGEDVCLLSSNMLRTFAEKIHQRLADFPHKMLPFSPEQIYQGMHEYRSVLVVDIDTDNLLASAQCWEYEVPIRGQKTLEFGTWLSSGGYGSQVLEAGSALGAILNPHGPTIAVVEHSNTRADKVVRKAGGELIACKYSEVLKDPLGEQARMNIYDISAGLLEANKRKQIVVRA